MTSHCDHRIWQDVRPAKSATRTAVCYLENLMSFASFGYSALPSRPTPTTILETYAVAKLNRSVARSTSVA